MATDYETQRLKNIAANLAILASLGLEKPSAQKPSQQQQKAKAKAPKPASDGVKREGGASRKRKALTVEDEKDGGSVIEGGRRKSARIVRAAVSVCLLVFYTGNRIS